MLRFALALLALSPAAALSAEVDFLRDIRPILTGRCVRCHSESLEQEGGLKLDRFASLMQGGEHGAVVVAGKSAESKLVVRVTATDDTRMPPTGERLTPTQIELLKNWIDQGARGPSVEAETKVDHWAFRKPAQPTPPRPNDGAYASTAVDAFVRAAQEARQLTPVAEAPRNLLLRRVYLDLIGLPPTADELQTFLVDDSPDAYERVVDRLLADPNYGERWGRHWMDVWRYSDWDGYNAEVRESKPHIWRWRDWIVESLNEDKPYGRIVEEMLAGDELAPDDPRTLRATGFLVRNWYKFNRNTWLDSTVEHTGKAFLGLTFNCARCHNHMYDPITHTEYYQLRAIFEPYDVRTDRVPGEANVEKNGLVRAFDANAATPTFVFTRGNEKVPQKDKPLTPGAPKLFAGLPFEVQPVTLPPTAYYPGRQAFFREEVLAAARKEVEVSQAALAAAKQKPAEGDAALELAIAEKTFDAARLQLTAVEARLNADDANYPPRDDAKTLAATAGKAERDAALAAAEKALLAAEWKAEIAKRAMKPADAATEKAAKDADAAVTAAQKAKDAAATAAMQATDDYTRFTPLHPTTSTGRRLTFARFITSPDNPLFTRVAINHVWLRHFGSPLVPTMFDFGMNGKPPSHPELLDWLAVELRDNGGQMKAVHRLLVTSRTYRAACSSTSESIDADNRYYQRANAKRLEAEIVRDATLAVADSLDTTRGGADLDPNLGLTNGRRSVYFRATNEKRVTFLALFDGPNVTECYRRSESVAPQQALAMVNSTLTLTQARKLAASIRGDNFVYEAFVRILCRPPTDEETTACRDFLAEQTTRLADPKSLTPFGGGPDAIVPPAADPAQRARENLVHTLLNHNDFITVR